MDSWKSLLQQLLWEAQPQTNYHGTPYTFNKFDDSKFLTGEGHMAHGRGHYSADFFNTAERYKRPSVDIFKNNVKIQDDAGQLRSFLERVQPNIDDVEYLGHEKKRLLAGLENAKLRDEKLNRHKDISPESRMKGLKLDALDNLDKYRVQYNQGNVYRVNVPNENYMWKEFKPLSEQSEYIQKLFKNRNIDFSKMLYSGLSLDHDLEGLNLKNVDKMFGPMYDQLEYRGGLNKVTKKIFNRYMNELPLEQQLRFMERTNNQKYFKEIVDGITGIRAIGSADGPINVTFTGDDIKMANTPLQRFLNRIPTQTLGKMANKAYNIPAVKQAIRFLPALGTAEMIYQGLEQPVGRAEFTPEEILMLDKGQPLQGGVSYRYFGEPIEK